MIRKLLTIAVGASIAASGTLAAAAPAAAQLAAQPAEERVEGQQLTGAPPLLYVYMAVLFGLVGYIVVDEISDDDGRDRPPPPPVSP